MKILFIARRFSYLKNFEGPIFELARRGHTLHLVALAGEGKLEGTAMVERWHASEARITFERLPPAPNAEAKSGLRARVSMMVDYLRYLEPEYVGADGLVERARRRTPSGFLQLVQSPAFRLRPVRRLSAAVLRRLEAAVPRRAELDLFLREQRPDVVLFTPLIALQSEEQDLLTAAVEQGLRTVFCVLSWDNLSSKAVIRTTPDLVTVWNDVQREEARLLHNVPDERIAVTGAQTFDHWFNRSPSRSRQEFLARVGLPPDRPFLLWVCSALFRTSPVEAGFVRRWLEALRSSTHPDLRDVPVLVRPHPTRLPEWANVSLEGLGPVSLWGANPVDSESRNDYFDSLYYSKAVVGLNTSAFLEAAIVGRPVYTVLLPEFRESQEGTLHFPYLLNVAGGLLHASRDMETHLADLAAAMRAPDGVCERSRRYVETFIRPKGLEVSATEEFANAIERLLARPAPAAQRALSPGFLGRRFYAWLEPRFQEGRFAAWFESPNEIHHREHKEAKRAKAREKAARRAEREQRRAARALQIARKQEAREAERQAVRESAARKAKEAARAERLRQKQLVLEQHRAAKRLARQQTVPS